MTRFTFEGFMNETSRFVRFNDGDTFRFGAVVVVEAEGLAEAREVAWAVGNREALDADGRSWPTSVRSLSVGDLLLEWRGWDPIAHEVLPVGFVEYPVVVTRQADGFRVARA